MKNDVQLIGESVELDGGRRSASFLLRVWLEPRDLPGEPSPVRGYLRNLQTQEEHYFTDPEMIGDYVLRFLSGTPMD